MEEITLAAQPRTAVGKQVHELRRRGLVPAVIYGHRTESQPLEIEERALRHVLQRVGGNQLIRLTVGDGAPRMVLVREVQREPIKRRLLHVDLYEVVMTERIRTEIPVVFTGASPVVKRGEGYLYHGIDRIEVECLPGDLIGHFQVNLDGLTEMDQEITVGDLNLGGKFEVLSEPTEVLARVIPLQAGIVEEAAPSPAAETEVEVVKREKPAEEEQE